MRKIFTFLFAALMSVGMWAQGNLVAVPDPSSIYEPTQIVNGGFETQPTMAGSYSNRIPNGTNQGWNTTETGYNCFECLTNVKRWHNPNLNPIGIRCAEMNADNAAALYQDLYTNGGDVIRWSLAHAVRTTCGPDEQYIRVDVGAPLYNGDNIVYPTGVNYDINTNINPDTKATYRYDGIENPTGHTYGFNGQDLQNLKVTKDQAYQWYYVSGAYVIPESQPVTRFAFVSEDNSSCGNLLDDISFSTLVGDLSATYGANNSVVIKGYWGETDTSKKLIIDINNTPYEVDMTSVSGQNFVITMTYDNMPTEVTIYHEDYVSAERTISVKNPISASAEDVELEYDGNAHTISPVVTDPESGYTLKYGTSYGGISLDELTYTTAGTYPIYYSVSAQDYMTYKGKATLRITNPASPTDIPVPAAQPEGITINESSHGSVVASPTSVEAGQTVTLTATPDDGYQLKSISVVYLPAPETLNNTALTVTGDKFQANATQRIGNGWKVYNSSTLTVSSLNGTTLIKKIEFTSTWGNKRKNDALSVSAGTLSFDGNDPSTTVTINDINATSVTISGSGDNAAKTWCISSVTVYTEEEFEISDTENANVKTFTMVDGQVTISAEFEPVPEIVNPVQIGDLYYNLDADNMTAEVISMPSGKYTGDIIIPASVDYNSVTYTVTSIGENAFENCEGLTSIEIPNSVTSIGMGAFAGCSGLTSITIPNSVISIGAMAFVDCSNLASIEIPNSVISIGSGAFGMCGLTSIEIPNSVEYMGELAFAMCSSLETVTILAESLESCGSGAFDGTAEGLKIYVPAGSEDTYKAALADYADKIKAIPVEIGDPNNATEIETFLTTNNGQTINELIIDRPVLNNMYNTLCLPFDMNVTQIAASSLNGVEIFELNSVEVVNDELFLGLSDAVNAVVAGRPYIVKYSAASQLDDLDFENVTINNADLTAQAVTMNGVTFKGTFTPFVMGIQNGFDTNGGYLFLGQNNVLYWPNTNNPLKPFRAYFYIDLNSGPSNAPLRFGMPARIGRPAQMPTGVENAQGDKVQSTKVLENGVLYIIKNGVRYNAQGQVIK